MSPGLFSPALFLTQETNQRVAWDLMPEVLFQKASGLSSSWRTCISLGTAFGALSQNALALWFPCVGLRLLTHQPEKITVRTSWITPHHFIFRELIRKGRTWAIAVRRGSCESLFLPNSGRFSPENREIQFWTLVRVKRPKSLWPKFFPPQNWLA